ncbi:type II and III secretion system protein family protein [Serratia marcescens]|uniref:type II and III secretion system protein family protein n=1 Tax=Serratia marcescens TaxID=615 RepID=UPI00034CB970|nr:pilus assembly protein N-terminal domain-containing protein [Serratia marcescens]
MNKAFYQSIAGALCGLTAILAHAGETYLAPGESRVIQAQGNIDTVFISAQNVADYELIGDKSLVAYAKDEGRTDLIAFDKNGDQVLKTILVVDSVLSSVHNRINQEFPDSNVTIQKMGKTYIISGTAPTEEAKERIYQVVGEGIGAEAVINKKQVTDVGGSSSSGNNDSAEMDQVIYRSVINKLELPSTNQVNVKLSVVEVSRAFTDNVGIDWGTISGSAGNITPGMFRFVKFDADSLSTLVHAISNESVARVLAEPNLSVLSGETAEFLVGGEVPVVTTSNNGTNVQYKAFGIKLNIGAKVSSSKKIRVSLGEEVSNVDKTYNTDVGSSFPAFQTRRAKTTVELADGESFLLGGLISNNEREALAKIPFIGDVPILGALFRNASSQRTRSELIVVATVNLVKPVAPREIVVPDFNRTSTWARFLNFDDISDRRDKQRAQEFIEQGGFIK